MQQSSQQPIVTQLPQAMRRTPSSVIIPQRKTLSLEEIERICKAFIRLLDAPMCGVTDGEDHEHKR